MIKRYKNTQKRRLMSVRSAIAGTSREYRLAVHKTNKYVYAQIVEIATGKTVSGVGNKSATETGKLIAQKAKAAKIKEVVFDRGKNRFHGKVKLLAESAREGGLIF